MKGQISSISFTFFVLICFVLACQQAPTNEKEKDMIAKNVTADTYDAALAKRYGADDYGMKKYVMAFLKKGPNRDRPKEESDALQSAHMENIGKLAEAGKLVLAGPFLDDGELRGIYIFDVETVEEAKQLTETDPAIKAGSLIMELHPWYGSAACVGINEVHKTLMKKEI